MADDPNPNNPRPSPADAQSVLPDDIIESIALGGFSSITGQPSSLANLSYSNAINNNNSSQQNTVANQQAMNQVAQSVLGSTVNLVADINPMEAVAVVKMDTGNDVAQQLMDLKAAVSGTSVKPRPKPPLPTVSLNQAGGSTFKGQTGNFPVTLSVLLGATRPTVKRHPRGGTIVTLGTNGFPIEFYLQGSPNQDPKNGTAITVPQTIFPIIIEITSSGGPGVEDNTATPSVFTVNEAKFPVVVSLATLPTTPTGT
ncbi:MAG TPA: hypothetical protein VF543_08110 [Pyrinomonadaceae bacterium]|jgi:hypothetical protein